VRSGTSGEPEGERLPGPPEGEPSSGAPEDGGSPVAPPGSELPSAGVEPGPRFACPGGFPPCGRGGVPFGPRRAGVLARRSDPGAPAGGAWVGGVAATLGGAFACPEGPGLGAAAGLFTCPGGGSGTWACGGTTVPAVSVPPPTTSGGPLASATTGTDRRAKAPAVTVTIPARERSPCMGRRYKAHRTARNAREGAAKLRGTGAALRARVAGSASQRGSARDRREADHRD
jgi:hypothetical protein